MSDSTSKLCPLSFDGERFAQTCLGVKCAWWADDTKLCALEVAQRGAKGDVKPTPKVGPERRARRRFSIAECTVTYKKGFLLGGYGAEPCPIVNLSAGGLQFRASPRR
jgi:hypothetical protein